MITKLLRQRTTLTKPATPAATPPAAPAPPPVPGEYLVYPGGRRLRLPPERMAAGAEADLYRCGPGAVVKMPRRVTALWAEKAEWAVKNRNVFADPQGAWAAWPQRLVVDPFSKQIVGVVLPMLENYVPLTRALDPVVRQKLFPDWDAASLVGVAANVLAAFDWLHRRGVVHGDGSPANVMVDRAGRVALIDCDSSQYATTRGALTCGVTTGDYCPPELQPKTEEQLLGLTRTPSQDIFSAVVIALQLLGASGAHPYSGRWDKSDGSRPPATERRIELNAWHGAQIGPGAGKVSAPAKSLPLASQGEGIVELTLRTFDGGWRDPAARPALSEWLQQLARLRRALRPCVANARHAFDFRLPACPYCEARAATGLELLPRPPRNGLRLKRASGWATGA